MNTSSAFLSALETLDLEIDFDRPVIESQKILNDHCEELNRDFFEDRLVLTAQANNLILPPVSMVASEELEKYKYAFFSLNPGLDTDFILYELSTALAKGNWLSYSKYYTDGCNSEGGLFNDILPESAYFQNRIALIAALGSESKAYMPWGEITQKLKKAEKKEKAISILREHPLIVSDFIPFHSTKFDSKSQGNLIKFYQKYQNYQEYNKYVLNFLFNKIESETGYLFIDGKSAKEVFFHIYPEVTQAANHYDKNLLPLDINAHKFGSKVKLSTAKYRKVKIVVLHNFLRAQGAFNSGEQIQKLINISCDKAQFPEI